MSRGSLVSTGQVTGNTFTIMVTDKMALNARIIVYYVRPDGEIVTDSISFDVDGVFQNKVRMHSFANNYPLGIANVHDFYGNLTDWL